MRLTRSKRIDIIRDTLVQHFACISTYTCGGDEALRTGLLLSTAPGRPTLMHIRHKIFFGYLLIVAATVALVAAFFISLADINAHYDDLLNRKQKLLMQA